MVLPCEVGMVPLPCTKKRLARVGEALVAGEPSAEDLDLYAAALDAFDQRTVALRNVIDAVDWPAVLGREVTLHVTGRTKTLSTLVDKLGRQPEIKLPYIRDISGVRVVGELLLSEQDVVGGHLQKLLGPDGVTTVDRRASPESGYRALHVVVHCGGLPAEIQVRTDLQAAWADLYERQADVWGREMRYGKPPLPDPDGSNKRRLEIVAALQAMSLERIGPIEDLRDRIAALVRGIGDFEDELAHAKRERGPEAVKRQSRARTYLSRERPGLLDLERQVAELVEELKQELLELGASAEQVK